MASLLIVDDETALTTTLGIALRKDGHQVECAASLETAVPMLEAGQFDIVLSDIRLRSGEEGLELQRIFRDSGSDGSFILMTGHGDASAIQSARIGGAAGYLTKGPELVDQVRRAVASELEKQVMRRENRGLRRQLARLDPMAELMGSSPELERLKECIRNIAGTESTVMIRGESGTGKELAARAIHGLSPRRDHPFIGLNCGALPESLLESELFGSMKGAYTGAYANRRGLFETASQGTLFLDEIGDMPAPMQAALLRVLQERRVRPLGAARDVPVDVRLIVATHQDLEAAVREGRFREDLYYRINVIPLAMPPLRARREDIPALAQHFLQRFARDMHKPARAFSEASRSRLCAHDWPGNVRQLQHCVERSVALSSAAVIEAEGLESLSPSRQPAADLPPGLPPEGLEAYLARIEEQLLRRALEQAGGVRKQAAELLRCSYRSFRHGAEKHNI